MKEQETPQAYRLDVTGQNGVPFRFVLCPEDRTIRYFDRRYALPVGTPGYGTTFNENGQSCGPALDFESFTQERGGAARYQSLHDVWAWDVDDETMETVRAWVQRVMAAYAVASAD